MSRQTAIKLKVEVGVDHTVRLPDTVPVGSVELIVLVDGIENTESRRALDALEERGVVDAAVARRVREHLDLAAVFAGAAGVDLAGPWLAASEDGSVGLDWRHGGRRCAITFDRAGGIEFYASDSLIETSGPIESPADAMKHIAWLARADEVGER